MISVIIATYNGEDTLPLTLEALAGVLRPDEGVEFLVVDNASTDHTAEILREARLPLAQFFEPRPGKSFALNHALRHAKGRLLVFADDDVLPETEWLEAYVKAARQHPEVGLFAGQVRHYWQKKPPKWLEQLAAEGWSYGGTAVDLQAGPAKAHIFKGANFMTRREALDRVRFHEEDGVNFSEQSSSSGGEDTRLVNELVERGEKAWYVPEARVRHIVRAHQVGVRPVLQRYFRIGRAIETNGAHRFSKNLPTLFGYPRYLIKTIPLSIGYAIVLAAQGKTHRSMSKLIGVAMTCGQAFECKKTGQRQS